MINGVNGNSSYNNYTDYDRKQQRIRSKTESLTARVSTIANDDKRATATELKNRILHGNYSREKTFELNEQLREMVMKHGDINPGINITMQINVGTEDEPIWAAIRGDNIFIKFGSDDSIDSNTNASDWVSPWTKIQDVNSLDENIISRLMQYQEILRSVNGNVDEPVSRYLFDNLRDATNFFNDNDVTGNEERFGSFVNWLFTNRASNAQEIIFANQLANSFSDMFFAQLRENMNAEQAFLTAWNSIQPPQEGIGGYNVMI